MSRPLRMGDMLRDSFGAWQHGASALEVHALSNGSVESLAYQKDLTHADGTAIDWQTAPRATVASSPIGPKNCTRCNHRNEYLGPEHLSADGSYTCRGCK